MTDRLREALARLDRTRPPNLYRPDVDSVIEAARRWRDFPTDEDVEVVASILQSRFGVGTKIPDGPHWAARAMLEAVKREDR